MNQHIKLYLIVLIIAVVVILGFLQWQKIRQQQAVQPAGFGGELFKQTTNPGDNLPAVNPVNNKPDINPLANTNPYAKIKTNPFSK